FFETDLGVVGPMARTVEDLKLLWSVLARQPKLARRDVQGARIAVWDDEPGFPLAREVASAVGRAADALSHAGARVAKAKPRIDGNVLMENYTALLVAVISVDLPEDMFRTFEAMRQSDLKEVAERGDKAAAASYRLRATASYRDVMRAAVRRTEMKDRLKEFFADWDAILMPISPIPAFKHLHEPGFNERTLEVDGRTVPYSSMLDWIAPPTALHAPSLAVPAGKTASGLPVGVQIVGSWHGEDRLFDLGAVVE